MAQETFSPFSGGIESEKGVLKACSGHLLNAHSEREREREREKCHMNFKTNLI